MKREIKFRALSVAGVWVYGVPCKSGDGLCMVEEIYHIDGAEYNVTETTIRPETVGEFTGLKDLEEKEIYVGDILEFENGDRVEVKTEDWLEVFCEPIGDPELEDQWRDLYRIERSNIIGNIYENADLIK